MDRTGILQQITAIFRSELDNEAIILEETTTAKDVEEWDSLSHVQLIVAIEKQFRIRFSAREIQSWQNIGTLVETIRQKLS